MPNFLEILRVSCYLREFFCVCTGMGANCCVAARNKPLPDDTRFEVSTHRSVRYSPSRSFRWDNRTHIEDIVDNPAHFSHQNVGNAGSEIRESEGLSTGGSPYAAFRMSPIQTRTARNSGTADQSIESNSSPEEKESIKSSETKSSIYTNSTPSRHAFRSPGYQLSRQASDGRSQSLKSLNEFALSGSQGASSDGWSMRKFTELVASSQRERWSFDSSNSSYSLRSKITRSNTKPLLPPLSPDLETCKICSKLLKERDPRSAQKIVYINELSVVAVLVCGHVYHADCLQCVTPETDRFEPPCPVCTDGDRSDSRPLKKSESKARSKISRIAVADIDDDFDSISECEKRGGSGRGPWMGASSSMKSSFGRPLRRQHFSFGSKSVSEIEPTRKKGFWARYRRD